MKQPVEGGQDTKLRRLAHPLRTWLFLVICMAVAILAFALGALVRSPDVAVLDARDQQVPVYAAVDKRAVSNDITIQGSVVGSTTHPVTVPAPSGAARAVVTGVSVKPGQQLGDGALLGTVSDRPVFVFTLDIPLYRDIHPGDAGSDVSSLQQALGVQRTGVMDWQTQVAIHKLYASAGSDPPGGTGSGTFVRRSEIVSMPNSQGQPVVRGIAAVGTVLEPGTPFAKLSLGSSYVRVRASVVEADQIAVGATVHVQHPGGSAITATVAAIGEFRSKPTDSGRPPGRDITIDLPDKSRLEPGTQVSVRFGTATDPVVALPTTAIRSDADGTYVLLRAHDDDGNAVTRRVSVTVTRQANGWTAIDADRLSVGDQVLVSS